MGREAALLFCEEGGRSRRRRRRRRPPRRAAAESARLRVRVDVADEAQRRGDDTATAEHFGGIDVLYNNAGISPDDDDSILDTAVDAWQRVQDVNSKASSSAANTASRTCSSGAAAR